MRKIAGNMFCLMLCIVLLSAMPVAQAAKLKKSPSDSRDYEAYTLANGMKVLLVSDPSASKAAAALDVFVGSKEDPEDRQGLAHFLEHMLFLGTEKYPDSGAYQAFISAQGGRHNAYTSFEHTNYFFDIDAEYLEPALDRFAQFFIAPLFNAEYVAREINAVDSEYRAKLKSDARRSQDVFKAVINQQHPFAKLSVGNVTTLLGDLPADTSATDTELAYAALREELLEFYATYYSADRMSLVILGAEPLSELKKLANEKFSEVVNRSSTPGRIDQALIASEDLPKLVRLEPEKDVRSLGLTFFTPEVSPDYKYKPEYFVANIIGHEGEGSLLSGLKRKGWAETLSAGSGLEYLGGGTFNVSITLTEAGLQHTDDIVAMLFELIGKIQRDGVERWRYKEVQKLLGISFRFQEQSRAISYVSRLAASRHTYATRDTLRGAYLLSAFKPRLIQSYLQELRPDNALITVMAKDQSLALTSPWYDTKYASAGVNKKTVERWGRVLEGEEAAIEASDAVLALPAANPFIPKRFALQRSKGQDGPVALDASAGQQIWWAPDTQYQVPKAQVRVGLYSLVGRQTAREAAIAELLSVVLTDQLNEFSYPAYLAGLGFSVRRNVRGYTIDVSGYSDKQSRLIDALVSAMAELKLDEQRLQSLHQELLRSWRNSEKEVPYRQLFSVLNETLVHGNWSDSEKLAALSEVSMSDLQQFWQQFLAAAVMDGLVYGNQSKDDAEALLARFSELLPDADKAGKQARDLQIVALPEGGIYQLEKRIDHKDNSFMRYHQGKDQSFDSNALLALSNQLMQSAYFEQLRTQQQLGYIVFSGDATIQSVPGMVFVVQAPRHTVPQIAGATDAFLQGFAANYLNEEFFATHKQALLAKLREPPKNQLEQLQRYWQSIGLGDKDFSARQSLIAALEPITLAQWKSFFLQTFVQQSPRTLIVWHDGGQVELASEQGDLQALSGQAVTDVKRFQTTNKSLSTYSSPAFSR